MLLRPDGINYRIQVYKSNLCGGDGNFQEKDDSLFLRSCSSFLRFPDSFKYPRLRSRSCCSHLGVEVRRHMNHREVYHQ